ncbi:hypothetical protein DFH09DRAFT_1245997 [Mycena vulgaris]|nr:hypothetical protein DFH09DRAFT_1245997 [Mycena vulgaris]
MLLPSFLAVAYSLAIVLADDTQSVFEADDLFLSSVLNATAPVSSPCCTILNSTLPRSVCFPADLAYEEQQVAYYSAEQREMRPACRVSPSSAGDISLIVQIATQNQCTFAVKSGGHMNWGGSNVGPAGFTIDLGRLTEVSVLEDRGTVSIGSGCLWREVYEVLAPYNLTTVGGRASTVGVGGFLLGGHGFGSDNVVNYLVVLADGTISNVNKTSLPDLYWALKYGSTNFGIVVRFDMRTYQLDLMWGGSLYFPISEARPVLEYLVDLVPNLADDPKGMSVIIIGWSPEAQNYFVWVVVGYREPEAFPRLFKRLEMLKPLEDTLRFTPLVSLTDELQDALPSGARAQWISLTLVPDTQMMFDLVKKGAEIFASHRERSGFAWGVTFQPINAGLTAAGSRQGGNPTGLSAEDGDLILYSGSISWEDPADDIVLKAAIQEYLSWARETAGQRGVLNKFIYLNYALGTQEVMASVGGTNVARLRSVRSIYDPQSVFRKYWAGGHKL